MAGKKTPLGKLQFVKALAKSPIGKTVSFMCVFTVAVLSHRWYLKPYFRRKELRQNEEFAEHIFEKGQQGTRAEHRH